MTSEHENPLEGVEFTAGQDAVEEARRVERKAKRAKESDEGTTEPSDPNGPPGDVEDLPGWIREHKRPDVALEPRYLCQAAVLQAEEPSAFARLKSALKAAGVGITDWSKFVNDARRAMTEEEAKRRAEQREASKLDSLEGNDAFTDTDNARQFAEESAGRLAFCHESGWLAYTGGVWAESQLQELALATQTSARIAIEAPDAKTREKLLSAKSVREMLFLARPALGVPMKAFDADPWLLNTPTGTVDLRSGELRAHNPNDRITKITAASYDPEATAPTWEAFLERVLPEPEVRACAQRLMGLALVGEVREHVFGVFCGTGANGKSTFLNAIQHALGDYAKTVRSEVLMEKRNDQHPAEVAQLRGLRLVVANESRAGQTLDEGLIKSLSGGDPISARFMRQDPFEFLPSHTLVLCTNHRPNIKGVEEGIWRRVLLFPWNVTIPKEERDPELPAKLRAEVAGVMTWLIRGCAEYQRCGLDPPLAVRAATAEYRHESDTVGRFLGECCVAVDSKTQASKLYDAFVAWCAESEEEPMSSTEFGKQLIAAGIQRSDANGKRWYRIGLRARDEDIPSHYTWDAS